MYHNHHHLCALVLQQFHFYFSYSPCILGHNYCHQVSTKDLKEREIRGQTDRQREGNTGPWRSWNS